MREESEVSDQKLVISYEGVQESLYQLRKYLEPCVESMHDAKWMEGDQTSAKWGTEPAAGNFSNRYRNFLARLLEQIDRWQEDLTMLMKRVNQAQEQLDGASAAEAATINQLLVDEWLQGSSPDQLTQVSAQLQ